MDEFFIAPFHIPMKKIGKKETAGIPLRFLLLLMAAFPTSVFALAGIAERTSLFHYNHDTRCTALLVFQ